MTTTADGTEDSDPDVQERFVRIHAMIGRYISDVNGIEQHLDAGIATHFKPSPEEAAEFRDWVLSRIALSEKVQLARQIVRKRGVDAHFDVPLKRLAKAIEYRNDLAHGHLSIGRPPESLPSIDGVPTLDHVHAMEMLQNLTLYKPHRTGEKVISADEDDIEERLLELVSISKTMLAFQISMVVLDSTSQNEALAKVKEIEGWMSVSPRKW